MNQPENITTLPDFQINASGPVSIACKNNNLHTFHEAIDFIHHLAYGRNADKLDLKTLFIDKCGTCSTKHALLKQLASEHGIENIHLVVGLFRMNGTNTPAVAARLERHQLDFIPEAHCYLKFEEWRFDFTKTGKAFDFEPELIEELEILPEQITDYKVKYHKTYIRSWLGDHPEAGMGLEELWTIREQCIQDLSLS